MEKYIKNAAGHLHTIDRHRFLVFIHCVRAGIPIQGLLHDLSKYSPSEFISGIKYYQDGDRSPNVGERLTNGYSKAWLHHKGKNKHHFEYWLDNDANAFAYKPVEMPVKYVIEMFCDRMAASKVYKGKEYTDSSPLEYFRAHVYTDLMNKNTHDFLEKLLIMLSEEGEAKTFAYIRKLDK